MRPPYRNAVRALIVAMALASLGVFGATLAAFTATTDTSGSTFSAAASWDSCPSANLTPLWLTGFEHGGALLTNGGGIFDAMTGTPTADSVVTNSGDYSLKVLDSAAGSTINGAKTTPATSSFVARFAIRLNTLPVGDVAELARVTVAAGNHLQLGFGTHSNVGAFKQVGGGAVAAGDWALVNDVPVRATGIGALSHSISQAGGSTASYLEVAFANTLETCIKSVWALAAGFSNLGASHAKVTVVVGSTERVVYDGNWLASLPLDVRSAVVVPISQPSTAASLNALVARFGYSSNAAEGSREPSISGLMLEYEVGAPSDPQERQDPHADRVVQPWCRAERRAATHSTLARRDTVNA
jgi:hypothetical protein